MAFLYETSRATTLENSVRDSRETAQGTYNEYSVPFNHYSSAPHLIESFTVSGVTETDGAGDTPNGEYTKGFGVWYGPNGHTFAITFSGVGEATSVQWEFLDSDYSPYSQSNIKVHKNLAATAEFIQNRKVYPFAKQFSYTDIVGDFSSTGILTPPSKIDF